MPELVGSEHAVLLVIAGVILANILAETGIFSRLSSFTGPLCRFSGLSDACVLSIVAMGVNATAGKSMLAEYYRDGKVTEREVIPVLIMGAFPVVLGESLFRVQLPTALVLLGPVVGGVYTGLNLFSSGIQALFALIYSRRFLAGSGRAPLPVTADPPRRRGRRTGVRSPDRCRDAWRDAPHCQRFGGARRGCRLAAA